MHVISSVHHFQKNNNNNDIACFNIWFVYFHVLFKICVGEEVLLDYQFIVLKQFWVS